MNNICDKCGNEDYKLPKFHVSLIGLVPAYLCQKCAVKWRRLLLCNAGFVKLDRDQIALNSYMNAGQAQLAIEMQAPIIQGQLDLMDMAILWLSGKES